MIKKFDYDLYKQIKSVFVCVKKKKGFLRENSDLFWWLKEIDFGL